MKLFLIVSLCIAVELARTGRADDTLVGTSVIRPAIPQNPRENVQEARRFDSSIDGDEQKDDIVTDNLGERYSEVENDLEDKSSARKKRTLGALLAKGGCNTGCGGCSGCGGCGGCGGVEKPSHADKLKQHLSRIAGLKALLAYKAAMQHKRIADHFNGLLQKKVSLIASLGHGGGHGGSCCPNLACCPARKK